MADVKDMVLQWSDIQGRLSSSVTEIDKVVSLRHSHSNKTVIDKFAEDANGDVTFNGNFIDPILRTNAW